MVTMTRSTPFTASVTDTTFALVSAARAASDAGPRELATEAA
jgi:hypothetical protein